MKRQRLQTTSCPVCGSAVPPQGQTTSYPFCSERCRTIDLGRWLDERYRIPSAEQPADDEATDGDRD